MTEQRKTTAPPMVDGIPQELKDRPQWIVWRYELRGDKWTKVPYVPHTANTKARSNAPSTWRSFHSTYACYLERPDYFDGIGYMFAKNDPYVGGDSDHCVRDGIIGATIPPTYAEISPSGEGIKFIARATGHYGRKTVKGELYSSGRFFTITGRVIPGHERITECQAAVDQFLASLGGQERKNSAYNSNGSRAQLAAAIPAEEWAEGRRLLRDELSRLLARLRASTAPTTQLGYVLKEDYHGLITQYPRCNAVRADGSLDSSQIRAIFANGVRGRGFTFPQFVALFYHFYGADCLAKWGTTQGFREEAATLWAKARPARPGDTPVSLPVQGVSLSERMYQALLYYKAGISAIVTLEAVAHDLHIHRGTASKVIKELVKGGRISTQRHGSHGGLVVEFLPELISDNKAGHTNADNGGSPSAKITEDGNRGELIREIAVSGTEGKNNGLPSAKIKTETATCELISAEVETALDSAIVESPLREEEPPYIDRVLYKSNTVYLQDFGNSQKRLVELAKDYLDQPAEQVGERLVNAKTGQVTYRRSAKHFAELVGDAQAEAAYKAEQERRTQLERSAWQRFFAQLKAMSDDELIAYISGGCRRSVAELARDNGIFDKHLYETRLKCAKRHLSWRGLEMPERQTKGKPVTPRKPARKVVIEQPDLFEDTQSYPDAHGTIARLMARKANAT